MSDDQDALLADRVPAVVWERLRFHLPRAQRELLDMIRVSYDDLVEAFNVAALERIKGGPNVSETAHAAGCIYGGFSCQFWMIVDGCEEFHPETHYVTDDRCPCGTAFPGAGTGVFVSDAQDKDLPVELQDGLGGALFAAGGRFRRRV